MNRNIIIALLVLVMLAFTACGGNSSESASKLEEDYGLTSGFHSNENDSWLVTSTANSAANDPKEWALDYYNEYGKDVDVIWVVNFANHTTTQIRNDSADGVMLYVAQMDGSDDVEKILNAGQIYSGPVIAEFYLYVDDDGNVKTEDVSESE